MQIMYDTISGELRLEDATGHAIGTYHTDAVLLAIYGNTAWRATSRHGSRRIELERISAQGAVLEAHTACV